MLTSMRTLTFESCETLTQAEFAQWVTTAARDDHRYELLNARVVREPPAGWPHGRIEARLLERLVRFVRAHDPGEVFGSSQGFELPSGDTVAPDAAFVSHDRWRGMPSPEEGRFLRVVPDLVVEILSTATGWRDRGEKKAIYERNGVREYWLVDARAQRVTRMCLREGRFDGGVAFGRDDVLTSEALAGLEIVVGETL
jgi:Uma2 family endonuclease